MHWQDQVATCAKFWMEWIIHCIVGQFWRSQGSAYLHYTHLKIRIQLSNLIINEPEDTLLCAAKYHASRKKKFVSPNDRKTTTDTIHVFCQRSPCEFETVLLLHVSSIFYWEIIKAPNLIISPVIVGRWIELTIAHIVYSVAGGGTWPKTDFQLYLLFTSLCKDFNHYRVSTVPMKTRPKHCKPVLAFPRLLVGNFVTIVVPYMRGAATPSTEFRSRVEIGYDGFGWLVYRAQHVRNINWVFYNFYIG